MAGHNDLPKATNRQLRDYENSIAAAKAQLLQNRSSIVEDIQEREAELRALKNMLASLDRTLHNVAQPDQTH